MAGYREGLGEAWDPALVFTAWGNHPDTGRRALQELLALDEPPTAVLAMSDALASGVLREATEQGLDLPRDRGRTIFTRQSRGARYHAAASAKEILIARPPQRRGARAVRLRDEPLEAANEHRWLARVLCPCEVRGARHG